jgi:DNA-binding LacI/PurR family transcriptional regulator
MNVYDLAKRIGVSTATVSRVLNNSGPVKAQTRQRVLDALEASNYTVNDVARSLAMRQTQTVAILTTDVREYYYSHTAYAIEQRMAETGYNAFLCNTGGNAARQAGYIHTMLSKRVAALVVLGSSMRDDVLIAALLKASKSIPIVMTNANLAAENTFCIERDDAAGIRLAMARLMERGCRSLCFVSDYLYYSDHYKQQVFMDIADAFGLKHVCCSQTEEIPRAEGYVCSSDMAAAKLIKSLASAGVRIPDDALAVGYDNTDLAPLLTPTLTSIDSDITRQSQIAADTLQALLMDGVRPQNHVLITPTLVIRESA